MTTPQELTNQIFSLYEQFGAEEYAGEKVSQLEHMVQAAQLAMEEGYDDEVVLAAFLHDVGHLLPVHDVSETMDGYGVMDHEKVGADWLLGLGMGERMCKLIASHVNAKRYLTWKYPSYYEQLSEASKKTLEYQGGRMEEAEAKAFEADPLFDLYIRMRTWDEAAKIEGKPLPELDELKQKLTQYIIGRQQAN
ncbi:HD domain-containing protein [Flavihumibacter cheonanensis]|uniref:HD domain-containing protein n=1 Tax=Flavihumibacter fluminis TaxID=2909236 RepID=A0ABS9BM60_9BACT|nr:MULTISPECIES: HD domain-containing protein [Flavihumibacter]MCF1716776.1 HD domain-containing protein [Flavihumibacter fluminis]MCG7752626.1 HD domain-containing protein [Flavihumibacter cheonanensis]